MKLNLLLGALAALAVCGFGGVGAASAASGFTMQTYHDECNEAKKLYASCHDQRDILDAGLEAAREDGKLAVVVLGFNDCPPCYILDRWIKSDEGQALLEPYTLIKLSILDPERKERAEVFGDIIPGLKLPISDRPPFGVPYFFILDPEKMKILGTGIGGFNSRDTSKHEALLRAHADD